MPILIAHRGNIHGPEDPNTENHPSVLRAALNKGFHIEVDVWKDDGRLYLGHDEPRYPIDSVFELPSDRTWWHCKNWAALRHCLDAVPCGIRCFWHEDDQYALVVSDSGPIVWVYPGRIPPGGKYVQVLPERTDSGVDPGAFAVCSDYVADL